MTPENTVYLLAIFVGCLIRTIAPFIRKWYADQNSDDPQGIPWNHKYTVTFIIAYIISIVVTAFVYQANPFTGLEMDMAFFKGLILGVTANTIINEVSEWFFPDTE